MAAESNTSSTWHTDDTSDVDNYDDVAARKTTVTVVKVFISSQPTFWYLKHVTIQSKLYQTLITDSWEEQKAV